MMMEPGWLTHVSDSNSYSNLHERFKTSMLKMMWAWHLCCGQCSPGYADHKSCAVSGLVRISCFLFGFLGVELIGSYCLLVGYPSNECIIHTTHDSKWPVHPAVQHYWILDGLPYGKYYIMILWAYSKRSYLGGYSRWITSLGIISLNDCPVQVWKIFFH